MINKISLFLSLILFAGIINGYSQEGEAKTPVEDAFACTMLIESQTTGQPKKKGKEFIIHHRIGQIKNLSDLFGLYGPANARLGINYGVTDKLMIGIGTEKFNKMQDLCWKYSLIQQKENGTPVFISYFGNVVINASHKSYFGEDLKLTDRLSFFHQIIIARKLSEKLSIEIAPYFLHFNTTDSVHSAQATGASFAGRFKIWNEISFMAEFHYVSPLEKIEYPQDSEGNEIPGDPKSGFAFGFEKNTGTHAFQLFATTYSNILPQKNFLYNQRDFNTLLIGFNITARL